MLGTAGLGALFMLVAARPRDCIGAVPGRCTCEYIPSIEPTARAYLLNPDSATVRTFFVLATLLDSAPTDPFAYEGRTSPPQRLHRFRVDASWHLRSAATPGRTEIALYERITSCPMPRWRVGEQYLIYARLDQDTIRGAIGCGNSYPADSSDTPVAIGVLDSALTRR